MRLALSAGLVAWLVAVPAAAQGPEHPGDQPDQAEAGDQPDAGDQPAGDEDQGAEPEEGSDQTGADTAEAGGAGDQPEEVYEPDQRGYEPDQRGAVEEPEPEDQSRFIEREEAGYGGVMTMADEDVAYRTTAEGRWLWIEAFTGYSYVDLGQFDLDNLVPTTFDRRRHGSVTGLATGFRVSHLTFGLRGSFAVYEGGLRMGTLGFDTAFRFRAGPVEPFVRFGTGFVWLGGVDYDHPRQGEVPLTALLTELGVGVTGMVNEHLSLGAGVDFGILRLRREALDPPCAMPAECMAGDADLATDGDALGLRLDFHLSLGVHF